MWNARAHSLGGVIYSAARDITAPVEAAEERERLVVELKTALAEVRTLRELLVSLGRLPRAPGGSVTAGYLDVGVFIALTHLLRR